MKCISSRGICYFTYDVSSALAARGTLHAQPFVIIIHLNLILVVSLHVVDVLARFHLLLGVYFTVVVASAGVALESHISYFALYFKNFFCLGYLFLKMFFKFILIKIILKYFFNSLKNLNFDLSFHSKY